MAEPIVVGGAVENRNRRVFVLAGVAGGLVLALVVLPGILFGGGGTDAPPLPPPVIGTATTVPQQPTAETFEVFSDKNPFEPLVTIAAVREEPGAPLPPEPVPPAPTAVAGGDASVPADSDEAPIVAITDEGGDSTATTAPPPPPARQADRVSLLEVFIDPSGRVIASVRVNDVTYQVAEGDDFASSYRMLDLDSSTRCAQLLFGDDRFGLCEGEETLK